MAVRLPEPLHIEREYRAQLGALRSSMVEAYRKGFASAEYTLDATPLEVLASLGRRFKKLFDEKAEALASSFVGRLVGHTVTAFRQLMVGTPNPLPPDQAWIDRAIAENVKLIKSIPEQFHSQIAEAIASSLRPGGEGLKTIMEHLTQYDGVTDRRIQLIAQNQTARISGDIGRQTAKANGMKEWGWLHSAGGAHPRKIHLELSGKRFKIDGPPPVIDADGKRGYPGQLPNCRCVAIYYP